VDCGHSTRSRQGYPHDCAGSIQPASFSSSTNRRSSSEFKG
jgi:hypothetical protein